MKRLNRQIDDLVKNLTPRQLVIAQMLEWHEHDSLEVFGNHLEEAEPGEHDGIVFAKAMLGVRPGKNFRKEVNERLRAVAFFFHLATDMNFAVHERFEPMGLRLVACMYRLQRDVLRAGGVGDFDPAAFEQYSIGLEAEVFHAVGEVQGTAGAVERINRDYFGGQNMLFPVDQPELICSRKRRSRCGISPARYWTSTASRFSLRLRRKKLGSQSCS